MVRSVDNLLDIARGQIGYIEKASCSNLDSFTGNAGYNNHTKYARDLHDAGYYNGDKCGYAWCDVFVDWCFFILCGKDPKVAQQMICQTGDCGAGCKYSAGYYKNAGRLYKSNPKPGDQIFFGDLEHTGIVEDVSHGYIYTIEGNSNNRVERRKYDEHDSYINCFGRPRFEAGYEEPKPKPEPEKPTPKPEETDKKNKTHKVTPGESWWSIAEDELGDGMKMHELAKFNGTNINHMLHPGDVLKIPGKYIEQPKPQPKPEPVKPTPKPVDPEEPKTHKVKPGESWWSIADDYMGDGNKMHELAAFNGCTINRMLHPGDVLKIPGNNTTPNYTLYTVKRGDSWWAIADKMMGDGNKMYQLAAFNGKTINTMIHPGNVLKIPK